MGQRVLTDTDVLIDCHKGKLDYLQKIILHIDHNSL